jgi:hypothetical protein
VEVSVTTALYYGPRPLTQSEPAEVAREEKEVVWPSSCSE